MADHLEQVQWRVRPAGLVDGPSLGQELPVNLQPFSPRELREAVCKLKNQKATGSDDIPAEYWKAVITDTDNLDWLVALCNKCLVAKAVPEEWQLSEIKCLYKKRCHRKL